MSYGVNFCILALLIITPTKLAFIKVILYSSYHDIIFICTNLFHNDDNLSI